MSASKVSKAKSPKAKSILKRDVDAKWLKDIFETVDKDKSGAINANELSEALSNGTELPFNPSTSELLVRIFDKEKKRAVNLEEFNALYKFINEWTYVFKTYDVDGSGGISAKELQRAMTNFGYRLSNNFYEAMVRRFDRTNSGKLLFDDFMRLCIVVQQLTNAFREKDTDRDGKITTTFEEFLTMMFQQHLI